MAFPTSLTNAQDGVTDVLAAHINAVEAKIGVDSSAVTTSHDYKLSEVTSSDKAVGKAATQTLTNKTLTTPQINDTSSDHQYIFAPSELTADRTVTLPLLTGNDEFVFKDHAQTLTNKTLTNPKMKRSISLQVFDGIDEVTTGDGKAYFTIPEELNGANLTSVHARVITAGTTGTTDIQIRNVTDTADMLSTKLTIDSGETGSDTAATAAVINTSTDDVATNDLIAIDVDATSTTEAKGLVVRLQFLIP